LTHPLRGSDFRAERVQSLILETVDSLMLCPAERKEEATREALAKLRPHLEVALEALETIGRTRGLNDEVIAKREAFMMLLDLAGQPAH